MLFQEPKNEKNYSSKIIIIVILLSLLIGGVAGSLSSFIIWQNIDKLGFIVKDENGLKLEKVETEKITLLEEESATISVVEKASPSVVSIIISKEITPPASYNQDMFGDFFQFGWPFEFPSEQTQPQQTPEQAQPEMREIGGGTGFIVSADGLILTNKHVVLDEQAEYSVITNDGQNYQAEVLAKDTINDLALIKIEAQGLTPLDLGDSDNIQIGQTVIAIGNTLSEFRNTVTRGVISGIGRRVEAGGSQGFSEVLEQAIQTDAAINPGNSGGPLLNLSGQVIGINTAVSGSGQSLGFAIPINEAKQVINSVLLYGKIVRPFLGVRYVMINKQLAELNDLPVDYGALVIKSSPDVLAVIPGSPADKAGLEENDIILEVNSLKVDENNSLGRVLAKYNPGDEIELKIMHDGEEKTVNASLVEREQE